MSGANEAGEIPQSPALAEASADSLSDLFSRDPETLSQTDFDRLISVLRAQRERWQATEAEAQAKPKRASAKAAGLVSSTTRSIEDLGL